MTTKRIAFYLRSCGNLHYFAAIKPYLNHFVQANHHQVFLAVTQINEDWLQNPEYAGFTHLFTTDCDLDSYDLVVTPSFLRPEERSDRTPAVQIFHGMSDKPFTYERDFSNYLLCLCVGQRQVERLLQTPCNQTMQWTLIGYPKFDHPPTLRHCLRIIAKQSSTVLLGGRKTLALSRSFSITPMSSNSSPKITI